MTENVIEVVNVSKKYLIGKEQHVPRTLAWRLFGPLLEPLRRFSTFLRYRMPTDVQTELWALKDVSFSVKRGETFGIVGANGSGKSTLLKIVSHIVQPTEGYVKTRGRIVSLLEVGSGFHDELTGRENLFLNATILGMSQQEIREKYERIVEFAEVEEFMDTPIKRYSSGMRIRLAFAIAAHVEPEIMIVDEVFAVGDAAFREKCLNTIEILAKSGCTVLVVSHSIAYILRLCDRAAWLEKGRLVALGNTSDIADEYTKKEMAKVFTTSDNGFIEYPPQPEKTMSIRRAEIRNKDQQTVAQLEYTEGFQLQVDYEVHRSVKDVMALCFIETVTKEQIMCISDADLNPERLGLRHPGFYSAIIDIPPQLLNEGEYQISISLSVPYQMVHDRQSQALRFTITDTKSDKHTIYYDRPRPGLIGVDLPVVYQAWPEAESV